MSSKEKRSYRLSKKTLNRIEELSQTEKCDCTAVLERALDLYSDYVYMDKKATVLNERIIQAVNAEIGGLEQRLNNQSNQLLSAIAIELYIIQRILEHNVEVSFNDVAAYREAFEAYAAAHNDICRFEEVM